RTPSSAAEGAQANRSDTGSPSIGCKRRLIARSQWIRERESTNWPLGQVLGRQAPRNRFASCRTSSLSILYLSVLNGIPRYSAVAVTFHPHFSSARRIKFRSNVFVASSKSESL